MRATLEFQHGSAQTAVPFSASKHDCVQRPQSSAVN